MSSFRPCGVCGKVRSYLPESIRARLEEVERRIAAKKPAIAIHYTTTQLLARADSPRPLPASPPGGDDAGGDVSA